MISETFARLRLMKIEKWGENTDTIWEMSQLDYSWSQEQSLLVTCVNLTSLKPSCRKFTLYIDIKKCDFQAFKIRRLYNENIFFYFILFVPSYLSTLYRYVFESDYSIYKQVCLKLKCKYSRRKPLNMGVFWDMLLRDVINYRSFDVWWCLNHRNLDKEEILPTVLQNAKTIYPTTQRNITKQFDVQLHRCENLKFHPRITLMKDTLCSLELHMTL